MASKDLKTVVKAATEQGWRVDTLKSGHLRFRAPNGTGTCISGGTPSDRRALDNLLGCLRRNGLIWPWPPQ